MDGVGGGGGGLKAIHIPFPEAKNWVSTSGVCVPTTNLLGASKFLLDRQHTCQVFDEHSFLFLIRLDIFFIINGGRYRVF